MTRESKSKTSVRKSDLFALVESTANDGRKTVRRRTPAYVPLSQQVASSVVANFQTMADKLFDDNPTIIPFDGRYTPGPGSRLPISFS